jgi:cytidylate kinase
MLSLRRCIAHTLVCCRTAVIHSRSLTHSHDVEPEELGEAESQRVVTIDGGAASGKSSVAAAVARELAFQHFDSGALFRAITLALLQRTSHPPAQSLSSVAFAPDAPSAEHDINALRALGEQQIDDALRALHFGMPDTPGGQRFTLNGCDVTREIRSDRVTRTVSEVAAWQAVRRATVRVQRDVVRRAFALHVEHVSAAARGFVFDGRDIGAHVFPRAAVKIFLTASLPERAARRLRELRAARPDTPPDRLPDLHRVMRDLQARDRLDTERKESPLRCPVGAFVLDTSHLPLEHVIAKLLFHIRQTLHMLPPL